MTIAADKIIFDAYRSLVGPLDHHEVRLIKAAVGKLDSTGNDQKLFEVLGMIDDDDTISQYEFETLKQAIIAYQTGNETAPYVHPKTETLASPLRSMITPRVMQELLFHEAMVLEAYRDSRRIWTWGVGIATTSGFNVRQYKDNPQSIESVIREFAKIVIEKYAPDVLEAFESVTLTEYEFASALSFHYNTGAILRANWVKAFLKGNRTQAYKEFTNWRKPPEILKRRKAERDLFFNGEWTNDGKTLVYDVRKPGYTPKWSSARRIDVSNHLTAALA